MMRSTRLSRILCGIIAAIAMIGAICTPVAAQNNIDASLVAETQTPAPGSRVMLAIEMRPKTGWHGYWKNPGDAGFSARLDWSLPKGAKVGEVRFPVPERLIVQGLMNHVFNGNHALLVPLDLPAGLRQGTALPIRLTGDWLACTDKVCVPERATLALDLVVGKGEVTQVDRARFDRWRMKLPQPLGSPAHFSVVGTKVRIGIPFPATMPADEAWFFAETEKALAYLGPQKLSRAGDMLIIDAQRADAETTRPERLNGVLAFRDGRGFSVSATLGPVPGGQGDAGLSTILLALGGAFLGGILLNIMPCVFPVISLKAIGLARAGGDERAARQEALAYTAGVVITCLALGGVLLGLRASGQAVGWAFQLQNPVVILALLLLVLAITLNLAGLFHLKGFGGGEALAGQGGRAGAFWTGALAAFVATPCTGPFMAAALGAALVLPVAAALAIFAGLGLGLAAPFLLLGFVPGFRRLIPRPGPWIARFQRWMAIPMALTAAALLWLLWRQTGMGGAQIGVGAMALLVVVLWNVGKSRPLGVSFLALLAGVGSVTLIASRFVPQQSVRAPTGAFPGSEPFTEARLATLRSEGRPVFAFFTADWCVTCKVNEKAAIERQEVIKAFRAQNIAVLVGDWTNGDPALGRFIEAQGRSGVPLYIFYPASGPAQILPQILTPGRLVSLAQ